MAVPHRQLEKEGQYMGVESGSKLFQDAESDKKEDCIRLTTMTERHYGPIPQENDHGHVREYPLRFMPSRCY